MKIVHIGGYSDLVTAQLEAERALGFVSDAVGSSPIFTSVSPSLPSVAPNVRDFEQVAKLLRDSPDIICVHTALGLGVLQRACQQIASLAETLASARARGAKLVVWLYDALFPSLQERAAPLSPHASPLWQSADHFLVASTDDLHALPQTNNWSWVFVGADLSQRPAPELEDYSKRFRILHCPFFLTAAENSLVLNALQHLSRKRHDVEYHILGTSDLVEASYYRKLLSDSHILLEKFDGTSYGYLGLEAMACGVTVFSGDLAKGRDNCEHYTLCPVRYSSVANVQEQLTAILAEPKCLRDFGNRGRTYVEKCHALPRQADTLIATLKNLVRGGVAHAL